MEKCCDVSLVTAFRLRNDDDVITDFLKFDFVIISLKKHNLTKSHNFRSPKSKVNGRWGAESPIAWQFLKICY